MKFVDREEELSSMEDSYSANGSDLIVVYSRRRIGKTEPIRKFGAKW
jgi:AAA+ ATPase superfamily predicted ATPase